MCQSLKAKVRSPGPLAPGAQWLWARLEPMGHGRPSPLRRTMPRRFGQNFLQTWRLMRCRLADSRIRGNQKSEDGQAGLGLGGRGHGEIPRARPSAPSSSLSSRPDGPGPNRPLRQSAGVAAVRLGPDRKGHRADAIRQSQPDAEAPSQDWSPERSGNSLPRACAWIRAYGYAHIRARDLKLQIQKLNFQF